MYYVRIYNTLTLEVFSMTVETIVRATRFIDRMVRMSQYDEHFWEITITYKGKVEK